MSVERIFVSDLVDQANQPLGYMVEVRSLGTGDRFFLKAEKGTSPVLVPEGEGGGLEFKGACGQGCKEDQKDCWVE